MSDEPDEVDRHTFTFETTRTTNSVNVVLAVRWQAIVDRDLLHIDTAREQVCGDEYTT